MLLITFLILWKLAVAMAFMQTSLGRRWKVLEGWWGVGICNPKGGKARSGNHLNTKASHPLWAQHPSAVTFPQLTAPHLGPSRTKSFGLWFSSTGERIHVLVLHSQVSTLTSQQRLGDGGCNI